LFTVRVGSSLQGQGPSGWHAEAGAAPRPTDPAASAMTTNRRKRFT
jgi:hypothetical protein